VKKDKFLGCLVSTKGIKANPSKIKTILRIEPQNSKTFKTFCSQIGTKIHFASVRHPESNGLVERANGIIITGIMKSIFNQPKGKWLDELIKVV
jgi:hypothetical protein